MTRRRVARAEARAKPYRARSSSRTFRRRAGTAILLAATLAAAAGMTGQAAAAPDPDERLEDPALEARAREVGRELRCVVCQSQSIEESDAPLAEDLRRLVRERIAAGESNAEVLDYVADRYGDYVLLRPPVRGSTFILWGAPAGLILLAGAAGIIFLRRKETGAPTLAEGEAVIGEQKSGEPVAGENGLTEDERRRLAELELRARDA